MNDETTFLAGAAAVLAVVAAARGTWSPCGVSMLSSITPLTERGRGHRYRSTAAWFVTGAVAGGLTLGTAVAALAAGVGASGLGAGTRLTLACGAGVLAAASDAGTYRFRLPIHRRQVNERWLDQFRPWVYGAGFGWQIGAGLATYIKTSAVYLMIVLGALSGRPWAALTACALFGLVRGAAVLLGRRITTYEALTRFHRRMDELDAWSVRVVVTVELLTAVLCGWLLSPWVAVVVIVPVVALALRRAARAQPLTSTAGTRSGTMRTTTREEPGASKARRSTPHFAPTRAPNS